MAMAFANFFRAAVNLPRQRTLSQQARPGAEPHRASHFLDVNQIAELENNRVRRFDIEFGRVRVFKVTDVASEFNIETPHAIIFKLRDLRSEEHTSELQSQFH